MSTDLAILNKIKEVVLDIDPQDILNDARDYGFKVEKIADFREQPQNYIHIEKLAGKYAELAATYCAASGTTCGVGGFATMITLGGVDIAHMAAQLYRLNQKLAILNGFDPNSSVCREKSQLIYLKALGFDAAASSLIRMQILKAAAENTSKKGVSSNVSIRLIMEVAKLLGGSLSKAQAAKIVPFLGAFIGASVNYTFAKKAADKMISEYKSDYFDRWQL